jgi:hypothetical protein
VLGVRKFDSNTFWYYQTHHLVEFSLGVQTQASFPRDEQTLPEIALPSILSKILTAGRFTYEEMKYVMALRI